VIDELSDGPRVMSLARRPIGVATPQCAESLYCPDFWGDDFFFSCFIAHPFLKSWDQSNRVVVLGGDESDKKSIQGSLATALIWYQQRNAPTERRTLDKKEILNRQAQKTIGELLFYQKG
jgi:hypothetical protein